MNKSGNIVINIILCIIAIPIFFFLGIGVLSWLFSLLPGDDSGSPSIDIMIWFFEGCFGVFIGGLGIYLCHLAIRKSEKKQRQQLFGEHEGE